MLATVGQICADYFSKTIIQSKQEQKSLHCLYNIDPLSQIFLNVIAKYKVTLLL
jgi:hypothetical protein